MQLSINTRRGAPQRRNMKKSFGVFVLGLSLCIAGCGGGGGEKQEPAATQNTQTQVTPEKPKDTATATTSWRGDAANGKKLFESTCVPCHGMDGKGNGPAAKGLNPPPRNFTDKALMSKMTDEHIFQTIKGGGAAVGKSPVMPAQPQFTDQQLKDLISYVRHFSE